MKLKFHLGILLLLLTFSHAVVQEAPGTRTVVVVKSNLLFDAVLIPNLELKAPIGCRWSVLRLL